MVKCVYLQAAWETSPGLFGTEKTDHTAVDGHDLARLVEEACNEFERNGYAIVSVIPKVDGYRDGAFQNSAGWSYTAGALVVARRDEAP